MTNNQELLTFTLIGTPTDDGRRYYNSQDLAGFYFILGADEMPEAMKGTLLLYLELYLKTKIESISFTRTPRVFRRKALNIPDQAMGRSELPAVATLASYA